MALLASGVIVALVGESAYGAALVALGVGDLVLCAVSPADGDGFARDVEARSG